MYDIKNTLEKWRKPNETVNIRNLKICQKQKIEYSEDERIIGYKSHGHSLGLFFALITNPIFISCRVAQFRFRLNETVNGTFQEIKRNGKKINGITVNG